MPRSELSSFHPISTPFRDYTLKQSPRRDEPSESELLHRLFPGVRSSKMECLAAILMCEIIMEKPKLQIEYKNTFIRLSTTFSGIKNGHFDSGMGFLNPDFL
ncbi:hypothetical protein ACS0TY_005776 [Phlomoides rotata]